MYLTRQDYFSSIQQENLEQITNEDDNFRLTKEQAAITTIKSYLEQKYDVADEFRETVQFSYSTVYKAKQLVYLDADAYSATSLYALNALTLVGGNVYRCTTAITIAHTFNAAEWTLIGAQYSYYYIPTPYPEFNYQTCYVAGDFVFYKDKVYKCLRDSIRIDHTTALQYGSYQNLPFLNSFPTHIGQTQWSSGAAYSFTALFPSAVPGDFTAWSGVTAYSTGNRISFDSQIWQAQAASTNIEPGTDITKWLPVSYTAGDNRNSQLVEIAIHLTIYKLSPRISPRNVPDVWVKNYDDAIGLLKRSAKGEVTLDVPKLQPKQGQRIRWGSEVKNINSY